MDELDYRESLALENWCFWTVVLEETLESPLDCKEIQPVHPKGDQSWMFIGRTDAEAKTPIHWPPDVKNWLIWKDLDAGKDWRQEKKRTTEDEMVGWHHRPKAHEFGCDGQGGLVCCSPWGRRVRHDWACELNWTVTPFKEKWRGRWFLQQGTKGSPFRGNLKSSLCFIKSFIIWNKSLNSSGSKHPPCPLHRINVKTKQLQWVSGVAASPLPCIRHSVQDFTSLLLIFTTMVKCIIHIW